MIWHTPSWTPDDFTKTYTSRDFSISVEEIHNRTLEVVKSWTDICSPSDKCQNDGIFLLTGGAGFLGSRISSMLLERGEKVMIVSRNPLSPNSYLRCIPQFNQKIETGQLALLAADISGNNIDWMQAVPRIAVIIHLAASVHALGTWNSLLSNLTGLRSSIMLARRDGAFLDLASTLSVFVSAARSDEYKTTILDADNVQVFGGYAQTKVAAEYAIAMMNDISYRIIRYGLLVPESQKSFPNDHFAPIFMNALARCGVPEHAEHSSVDMTPVNIAAATCVNTIRKHQDIVHVAADSPTPLSRIVDLFPYSLLTHKNGEWNKAISKLKSTERMLMLSAFRKSEFLDTYARRGPFLNADLFQATGRNFMNSKNLLPVPDSMILDFIKNCDIGAVPSDNIW